MANNSKDAQHDPAFLDDFYAECDEHFLELRRAVSEIENLPPEGKLPTAIQESLARHLHSLKGILGMAEMPQAERPTHSTEDYLRALVRDQLRPTPEGLDMVAAVVQALEHAVAAHREKQSMPELSAEQARLDELLAHTSGTPEAAAGSAASPAGAPAPGGSRAGEKMYEATFTPTAELNRAGVNVNTVRGVLQELGELVRSEPRVHPGGGISFEFTLVSSVHPVDVTRWSSQGLTLREVQMPESEPATHDPSINDPQSPTRRPAGPAYVTPSHILRVDLSRLDELMRGMGEIVVQRARLENLFGRVEGFLPSAEGREFQEINHALSRELRRLRDGLMRVRLVRIAEIFERMSLVVRDLAREKGRMMRLVTRAAAALSELTGRRIVLEVPKVAVHPIDEVGPALADVLKGEVASVHQVFSGPVSGNALLLLDEHAALMLHSLLLGD